eukprot:gnl/TRDRNA2_/TRDRNA2_171892_c2_seq6.p2 gnl/TRDRNA2_/TRDRNA2_171892_c2~~gnl/TRDRNA2_/TRDRNA2_171892_c2_seq6.p2  ORF type:complete len:109 (+),score=19.05 gnl/TRDRNA2_/TRDRNA2_171892_c2_seq6:48-374(+)
MVFTGLLVLLFLLSCFGTVQAAKIIDAFADNEGFCWGNVGRSWCRLTYSGLQDYATSSGLKRYGYTCATFNGADSNNYCKDAQASASTKMHNQFDDESSSSSGSGGGS